MSESTKLRMIFYICMLVSFVALFGFVTYYNVEALKYECSSTNRN